jgi:hypothetical protein
LGWFWGGSCDERNLVLQIKSVLEYARLEDRADVEKLMEVATMRRLNRGRDDYSDRAIWKIMGKPALRILRNSL